MEKQTTTKCVLKAVIFDNNTDNTVIFPFGMMDGRYVLIFIGIIFIIGKNTKFNGNHIQK